MYTQVTKHSFIDTFRASPTYKDNFSYEGLEALFDYLEDLEEETETKINFDMVALCCEFSEYSSAKDACIIISNEEFEDNESALDYLRDNTSVIEIEGSEGIIIQEF